MLTYQLEFMSGVLVVILDAIAKALVAVVVVIPTKK
jgi:hypothetical protein